MALRLRLQRHGSKKRPFYRIVAIELAAAAQGIDLLRPLRSSEPIEALHEAFRRRVPALDEDREMAPILNTARAFLDDIDAFIEELD